MEDVLDMLFELLMPIVFNKLVELVEFVELENAVDDSGSLWLVELVIFGIVLFIIGDGDSGPKRVMLSIQGPLKSVLKRVLE